LAVSGDAALRRSPRIGFIDGGSSPSVEAESPQV
jgi:hypothetical protein